MAFPLLVGAGAVAISYLVHEAPQRFDTGDMLASRLNRASRINPEGLYSRHWNSRSFGESRLNNTHVPLYPFQRARDLRSLHIAPITDPRYERAVEDSLVEARYTVTKPILDPFKTRDAGRYPMRVHLLGEGIDIQAMGLGSDRSAHMASGMVVRDPRDVAQRSGPSHSGSVTSA